ncbi:unnamed protein product, partial [Vitis vinifera]|uniref:Uncharacterized protein n=1 Tax=Vitis vinifera TaxID=29760 RepID=D7T9C8_VITVI|eukprot:XP_010650258.1 PREDICTED: uncharacterized protein LOC104879344 [Vitis vinifera]
MSEKTCLLLSILLISVVFFFTLPTAGRVLQADAPAQEDNYESTQSGNGRSKIGVWGSKSNPTKSATGPSSPSQATPTGLSRRSCMNVDERVYFPSIHHVYCSPRGGN